MAVKFAIETIGIGLILQCLRYYQDPQAYRFLKSRSSRLFRYFMYWNLCIAPSLKTCLDPPDRLLMYLRYYEDP